MELVLRAAAISLAAVMGAAFLKRGTPELGMVLTLTACLVIAGGALSEVRYAAGILREMVLRTGLEEELFAPLWKIVGISLAARLGAELCRDGGQGALAAMIELCGALCAFVAAAPLLAAAGKLFEGWLLDD